MLVEKSMHPDWLSNAFLVAAEGGPALFVDSGADVAPLIEAVERWGVTPVAILRTHSHHDHVVNEEELAQRYSIPVLAEPGEWTWDDLHVQALVIANALAEPFEQWQDPTNGERPAFEALVRAYAHSVGARVTVLSPALHVLVSSDETVPRAVVQASPEMEAAWTGQGRR